MGGGGGPAGRERVIGRNMVGDGGSCDRGHSEIGWGLEKVLNISYVYFED